MTMTPNRGKHRYRCKYYSNCANASIETPKVIEAVCDAIENEIGELRFKIESGDKDEQKRIQNEMCALEKKISDLEKKEVALWDKYTMEGMPRHIFDTLIEKNSEEKEKAINDLKALSNTSHKEEKDLETIATLSTALEMHQSILQNLK